METFCDNTDDSLGVITDYLEVTNYSFFILFLHSMNP